MNYSFTGKGEDVQLTLEGDMDLYNVYEIKEKLKEKLTDNPFNLMIDLNGVSYIDSSGMGMLVEVKKMIEKINKKFRVKNIPENIMKLFNEVSLDIILEKNIEK